MSRPTNRQWHDVRTLPIHALKVLREVWRELFPKVPSKRIPRILRILRILRIPRVLRILPT